METWQVVLLGLIEGLTEYLPVSSTAHLLLTERVLGVSSSGRTFEVLIQLGAILALLTVYSGKLWQLARDFPSDPRTRRFVFAILIAFLPAVFIGMAAHKIIKEILFESPLIICISLVVGGIILLVVDRMKYRPRYTDVMDIPPMQALIIGFAQCLAMIPGVSRSGSTIVERHAARRRQAYGRGVLIFSRHADDDRGLRVRPLQELVDFNAGRRQPHRLGVCRSVRNGRHRGPLHARFHFCGAACRSSAGGAC